MALLNILEYPDPRLRKVATAVAAVTPDIQKLVRDMAETMYAAPGVGLAATQVDVHKRVIVIDVSEARDELRVFINPEIVAAEGEAEREEGCLSVPGYYDKVTRAAAIVVRAQDERGGAVRAASRGAARRVRAARDGPPAGQGLRRPPFAAQARAALGPAAQEATARGLGDRGLPDARRVRRHACLCRVGAGGDPRPRLRGARRADAAGSAAGPGAEDRGVRRQGARRPARAAGAAARVAQAGRRARRAARAAARRARRRRVRIDPAAGGARLASPRLPQHPRFAAPALARRRADPARAARRRSGDGHHDHGDGRRTRHRADPRRRPDADRGA